MHVVDGNHACMGVRKAFSTRRCFINTSFSVHVMTSEDRCVQSDHTDGGHELCSRIYMVLHSWRCSPDRECGDSGTAPQLGHLIMA